MDEKKATKDKEEEEMFVKLNKHMFQRFFFSFKQKFNYVRVSFVSSAQARYANDEHFKIKVKQTKTEKTWYIDAMIIDF